MSSQPSAVATWYDNNVTLEDNRLKLGRLEYAVTLHYIQEAIAGVQKQLKTSRPLRIADIGGGTGVYAIPLAQAGHEVSICDVSPAEVDLAKQTAQEVGVEFSSADAFDARELAHHPSVYKENHYDIILLLGPLYHILDEQERIEVLVSTLKMLRPGGYLLGAFVTRNAHLRDVATRDPERLRRESAFYSQYFKDGKYTRGTNAPMHHTTPKEIRQLMEQVMHREEVKAESIKMLSCEGFLGFQHGSHLAELDEEAFKQWLYVILASAEDEETLGAADHILVVMQRGP